MIQLSDNLIYIVGGWQNGTISNKTWIFDTSKGFDIKEGPSMNKERSLHSCGKMNINGKIIFVVAGGIGSKCNLDSVEILDPCYFGNRWKLGMCYFYYTRLVFILENKHEYDFLLQHLYRTKITLQIEGIGNDHISNWTWCCSHWRIQPQ